MDLRFPIWKPAPSNDDPSRVRIQESNSTRLVTVERGRSRDTIRFVKLYHRLCFLFLTEILGDLATVI